MRAAEKCKVKGILGIEDEDDDEDSDGEGLKCQDDARTLRGDGMDQLTSAQREAVTARGNVLVMAGRVRAKPARWWRAACIACWRNRRRCRLDELLLVTFTEAAAADMREKIRAAFERQIAELRDGGGMVRKLALTPALSLARARSEEASPGDRLGLLTQSLAGVPPAPSPQPSPPVAGEGVEAVDLSRLRNCARRWREGWLTEQLALFETAHIGTLHGFCLKLLRQHFYQLGLDPQLAVMAEEESRLLGEETLDEVLAAHYAKKSEFAEAVLGLIQAQGRGTDQPVRALVLRLHHYTQTLHDPEGWFEAQLAMFDQGEPEQWRAWQDQGLREWRRQWWATLTGMDAENKMAARCAALLGGMPEKANGEQRAAMLQEIRLVEQEFPRGKKTEWGKPLKGFFEEARFWESASKVTDGRDPLAEDWGWLRGQMAALLRLAREYSGKFNEAKRELGMVDFHDLEQHALRLLWDRETEQPTEIAREWRERLRFVFVDEYQDINDAQDAILKALSREGAAANRFLVGDVKQSIYGFRLANPRIFQGYAENWRDGRGTTIPLVENFRSREGILKFVNGVFGVLMNGGIGGRAVRRRRRGYSLATRRTGRR